ncbi:MAG: hypothetical protein WBS17_18740 [Candidatus Acidiferrales bacterium]
MTEDLYPADWGRMARYTAFVGKRVEAHYRAGDLQLSTIGTLASDTGKAIFVQERFSSGGKEKTMRVEIPYAYVIRVVEVREEPSQPRAVPRSTKKK